jgi:hypothetical protein
MEEAVEMDRDDLTFVNLGGVAYYALGQGKVLGLLYWTDEGSEDDEFVWCWAPVDAPHNHEMLAAPPLRHGMTQEQLEANRWVAKEELYRLLTGATSGS